MSVFVSETKKGGDMNTETQTAPIDIFRRVTGLSIGLAVLMIVLGFAAMFKPFAAGIGISLFIAWIIVFTGVVHIIYAFAARSAGSFLWRTLIGVAYILGGVYLLKNPSIALASLTLLVAAILIAEGVFQLIAFFELRVLPGSGWILCDAILTLILGGLIAYPWPGSSLWAIGTLVGVNLIISGFTRLMYSVAARSLVSSAA
jgi:uncharacterized membrane protein HdeD (DUF308 family)